MAKNNKATLGYGEGIPDVTEYLKAGKAYVDYAREASKQATVQGMRMIKLTLSSVGLVMSMIRGGKMNPETDRIGILEDPDDPENAQAFLCGDYFLPLNIQFSVNASKVTANSQLVDGINIIERIAKAPKIINCNFLVERAKSTAHGLGNFYLVDALTLNSPFTIRKAKLGANYYNDYIPRSGKVPSVSKVQNLSEILSALYENEDVFEIKNYVLNNELGVSHVFLQNYSITPQAGSTMFMVSMTMQEVNIKDSVIEISRAETLLTGEIKQ